MSINRRNFIKLTAVGGAVFSTGLFSREVLAASGNQEFYFVQLSDSHWGFNNKKFNADPKGTLPKAIETVNQLDPQPDFVVFTGDLTHSTDDVSTRQQRMKEFKTISQQLKTPVIHYLPGEHDAALDNGKIYKEIFGHSHYTFTHKGICFIALDNVSDPQAAIGNKQLQWLESELQKHDKQAPIVILTHRPLFDLAPEWGWNTKDGNKALALLMPYKNVTVLYGHIHQQQHDMTEHIAHHSAQSLIFPLSAPSTTEKKHKIAWNPSKPYAGLGFNTVKNTANKEITVQNTKIKPS